MAETATSGLVGNIASTVINAGIEAGVAAESATTGMTKEDIRNKWKAAADKKRQENASKNSGVTGSLSDEEKEQAEKEGVTVVEGKDGTFETSVNTGRMADVLGVDESLIIDDLNMTELEKQQNPYTKTDLSKQDTVLYNEDGTRLDDVGHGNTVNIMGCEVSASNSVISSGIFGWRKEYTSVVHVKSDYLGEFDYDSKEFALGYKELEDGSKLPVLKYIGGRDGANAAGIAGFDLAMIGSDIGIPDGLKSMDYMFTGDDHLKYVPPIPDSVTSMHYAFADCSALEFSTDCSDLPDGFLNFTPSWTAELDGYTVRLPDGLEDMSGAFKNCDKLNVTFAADSSTEGAFGGDYGGILPSSIVNLQEAFEGCERLEKQSFMSKLAGGAVYPQYGSNITPYLTSHYAKDALNKITNEDAKEYADSREYIVDEEGNVDEDKLNEAEESGQSVDREKLNKTRIRSRAKTLEDIYEGKVDNDSELSSGGARSNNYYYNAAEDGIDDDLTGLMVSDKKPSGLGSIWQRAAIDGAAGLGIAGLINKVTGSGLLSTIAGVGGAVALDYFDILPESLLPIMNWTKDKLPEGSWKDKMTDLIDTMTGSTINEQKENLTMENVAATYQNRRLQRSIWGLKGAYELEGVDESMYNNAEYCALNLNFKATADKALKDGEAAATDGARMVVRETVTSMEEMWKAKEAGGEDMSTHKAAMQDYYLELMEALESYNKGAKHGMVQMTDGAYKKVSEQGLDMLNRAYTSEVLDSLREMDAKYGFMDEAAWNKISSMGISGVDIRNIRSFDDAKAQELSNKSLVAVQAIITQAGEEYKTGVVLKPRDGESFYDEGDGKFYNEGNSASDRYQESLDELGDVAQEDDTTPAGKEDVQADILT